SALRVKLGRLIGNKPRLAERIDVLAIEAIGERLYEMQFGKPRIASRDLVRQLLADVSTSVARRTFTPRFLMAEWETVVDAWQLDSWESYRDVKRLGRVTRLPENADDALVHVCAGSP
ncbi:MAG: DNA helicase, partial [Gammaproteobacteria bacterium]|nr:DNA helicase [Gammaproteobacteria bacterium]